MGPSSQQLGLWSTLTCQWMLSRGCGAAGARPVCCGMAANPVHGGGGTNAYDVAAVAARAVAAAVAVTPARTCRIPNLMVISRSPCVEGCHRGRPERRPARGTARPGGPTVQGRGTEREG